MSGVPCMRGTILEGESGCTKHSKETRLETGAFTVTQIQTSSMVPPAITHHHVGLVEVQEVEEF